MTMNTNPLLYGFFQEDAYSTFQRKALLAEQWRRIIEEQKLDRADALFKLKLIGAVGAAMIFGPAVLSWLVG